MGQAYTPGLTITEETVVEKVRRLPLKGEVLVRRGDRVETGTVVARTHLPGHAYPMNAASIMNVEPGDLAVLIRIKEGDPVKKGEVIALSKGFFGFFKTPLLSPVTGRLESISTRTGQIIFREPPIPVEKKAYISGVIEEVFTGEGVRISATAAFIQGIFGVGGEAEGKIVLKASDPGEILSPDLLSEGDRGKIVVGGSYLTLETFRKAEELGVSGIITGGIQYRALKEIVGREIGVAITGAESLETTLLITEGFGQIAMSDRTFALFRRFQGERASMNGATQIRAGVIRPEVIIPVPGREREETAGRTTGDAPLDKGILVRIIRDPHFGTVGRVKDLPPEKVRLDSETLTRVVVIQPDEGPPIELPRANVEIISL